MITAHGQASAGTARRPVAVFGSPLLFAGIGRS